jgi:hypothetical protein
MIKLHSSQSNLEGGGGGGGRGSCGHCGGTPKTLSGGDTASNVTNCHLSTSPAMPMSIKRNGLSSIATNSKEPCQVCSTRQQEIECGTLKYFIGQIYS